MTAEVGVMNKLAVALAADSAVTIGTEKVYTSADKLFHLSKHHPIGLMINGNAQFLGIPWDTIIKTYRHQLKNKSFPKVKDYANDFLKFISGNRFLFNSKNQKVGIIDIVNSLYLNIRDLIQVELDDEIEKKDGITEDEIALIVNEIIKKRLEKIRERDYINRYTANTVRTIRTSLRQDLIKVKKKIFGKLPMSASASRNLATIAVEMISRKYLGPARSGLIFAGFGDKEFMPTLINYEIEEMMLNRPRAHITQEQIIDRDNSAAVIPFAQQEMVHSFMKGIDTELEDRFKNTTTNLFEGATSSILDTVIKSDKVLGNKLKKTIDPEIGRLLKELFKHWEDLVIHRWYPVVSIVSSLPKDELAAMAESLVNITKFRRRISPETESVGGPIDVAVISKGDGFVWVKRKHYFDPLLNPRNIIKLQKGG